jgi:translation initiation factor IF-2
VLATLIIKNGTLKKGSFVVAGESFAPVRIMENFLGKPIQEASFSSPVRIIGWSTPPKAGEEFGVVETKREAENIIRETALKKKKPADTNAHAEGTVQIPIVIKADALGVAEAVVTELKKVETDAVKLKIVDASAGAITENDVKLLSGAEGGIVIGFAVKNDARAKEIAERQNIAIELFDVIYKISEYMAKIIAERTPKVQVEEAHGSLKVLRTFSRTKDKQVIGGKVETGKIGLGDKVKIYRRDELVGRGTIEELQVQKIKAREVDSGNECGLMVEAKVEIATGDRIESFTVVIK